LTTAMPSLANTASKGSANFASRSRIKNRNEVIRSPRSITRFRACCVVQAAVGCSVTPRMCTRRVATSMTTNAYSRRRVTVSRWKKSVANSPDA
jgi:hypothetical protein